MDNIDSDLSSLHAKTDRLDAKLQMTDLKVGVIATKIGMWAAGGAILGGGVVSVLFRLVVGK